MTEPLRPTYTIEQLDAQLGDLPKHIPDLLKQIEKKDAATAAHTWRVVLYSRAMAEALGVEHERLRHLAYAAALHDVGKLDIADEILQKPGKLTDAEFEIIKTHTTRGHDRLVAMGVQHPLVLSLVRSHHERVDGKGYPDGIGGDEIPLAPRFFSVIDTFDALTSIRPYRQDVGEAAAKRAVAELQAGAGTRYCEYAVGAFVGLYERGELDWILGFFNDRCELPEFCIESGESAITDRKPPIGP